VRPPLIALLCITVAASTFPLGAFPALLPDLDRVVGLSDAQLGALSGMFGFARMLVDIPVGLVIARYLRPAMLAAPLLLAVGVLCIASGGPYPVLLAGRALMGAAHALGMIAWLTALLRHAGPRLGSALNAFEFSAMLGMLGGIGVLGLLPTSLPWNAALLIACAPQALGIVLAPRLAAVAATAGAGPAPVAAPAAASSAPWRPSHVTPLLVLAFVAGTTVSTAYSTVEMFLVPLRASREFGLDRGGVAWLLSLTQIADAIALLPLGFLADRIGPARVLAGVMVAMAGATGLIAFGGLAALTVGAALFGVGMAGWMLPLGVVREETPPAKLAWRTALYRVGVDGGMFLGPFLGGLLGGHVWILPAFFVAALVALAAALGVGGARR
jgi:MFS family permease